MKINQAQFVTAVAAMVAGGLLLDWIRRRQA